MERPGQLKKILKLNETDRKVLLAYSNLDPEQVLKTKGDYTSDKKILRLQ